MKPFHEWIMQPVFSQDIEPRQNSKGVEHGFGADLEVVRHNAECGSDLSNPSSWTYPCQSCGDEIRIEEYMSVKDFDPSRAYCGKGPFCIP